MSPATWKYVTSHAAGIAAIFLTIGHVIAGEYQAALESAAIAAAAWGLNLKPMLPLPPADNPNHFQPPVRSI